MNAILGMTEVVLDTTLSEEQRQWLRTVKSAADSLLTIIDELLDFSKIQAGKADLAVAEFSLRSELGETLSALALRAHRKGLELICDVDHEVPDELVGDAGRLRQILVNLIGNAIKFTAHGEVVVKVVIEPGGALRFAVRDTGIGISAQKHALIFEAFAQEDTSTTRTYGGTGLGLTIAARLAGLMGGSISVESEPGHGSTFTLVAPFERKSEVGVTLPKALRPGARVLIVDDSATSREVMSNWIRGWGAFVASVDDGDAALKALTDGVTFGTPYAVVLVDEGTPCQYGGTVSAAIRARRELRGAGIVLLSSSELGGSNEHAEEPHDARLRKPVFERQLHDGITAMLTLRSREADAFPTASPRELGASVATSRGRVLVAEDNEFNAILLKEILTKRGFDVELARDGHEALTRVEGERFDVLLLDLHMPRLDGFGVIASIRAREARNGGHIWVIAATARSRKEDRDRCLAAGVDDFVTKPIRRDELWAALNRASERLPKGTATRLLDAKALLSSCGGDGALLATLRDAIRQQIPTDLAAAYQCLRRLDGTGLREVAHRLYGMLAAISERGGQLATQIEDHAERGNLSRAVPLVDHLAALAEELLFELSDVSVERLRRASDAVV